jgi:hypothetical protein
LILESYEMNWLGCDYMGYGFDVICTKYDYKKTFLLAAGMM